MRCARFLVLMRLIIENTCFPGTRPLLGSCTAIARARSSDGTYGLWFHETEDVQRVAALFALYCPPSPTAAATLVGSSLPGHHGASGAAGAALIDANVSESGFAANGNSDSHAGAHMVAPDSMPFTADDVLKRLIMSATQSQPTATASFTPQPQYVPPPSATPSQQIPTAATASASTAAAPIPTAHQDPSGFLFHMITGGARVTSDSANGIQPPTKAHLNATPSTMNAPVAQLQASPKPATSSSLMHASQVPLQVLRHRATSSQLQQKSVSGATQSPRSAPSSQQPSVAQQAPPSLSAAQQQPNVTQLAPPFQQSSVVPPFQQSSLKEIGMPQQMIQQQQQQPMPQRLPPPPQHIQTRSEFLSWYAHMLHTDPVFQDVLYDAYLKRQYQHQLPYHHQQ